MEETIRGFDDHQTHSKILCPAVSNWAAWQINRALGELCERTTFVLN
ncbi:hypothetical protein GTW56_21420 [Bacillus sp. EB93]|nr:hypothetical protein [Peribacillus frigoritolerans]